MDSSTIIILYRLRGGYCINYMLVFDLFTIILLIPYHISFRYPALFMRITREIWSGRSILWFYPDVFLCYKLFNSTTYELVSLLSRSMVVPCLNYRGFKYSNLSAWSVKGYWSSLRPHHTVSSKDMWPSPSSGFSLGLHSTNWSFLLKVTPPSHLSLMRLLSFLMATPSVATATPTAITEKRKDSVDCG